MRERAEHVRVVMRSFLATAAGRRTGVIAAVIAALLVAGAGGALAARSASEHFADAALAKLGGDDPQAVMDSIAQRVVDRVLKDDTLQSAGRQLSATLGDTLGKAADDKLGAIDADALLAKVSSEVVSAGMGKIDEISTDAIVDRVTSALVERAAAEIDAVDLEALARGTLDDAVKHLLDDVDLDALIAQQLAEIDVEAVVAEAVRRQVASTPGGLLGLLFRR